LSIINHTESNVYVNGSTIIEMNDCDVSGSGNQGVQHYGTPTGVYNNIKGHNCFDEVFSGHGGSITVNGGDFANNGHIINTVDEFSSVLNNVTETSNTTGFGVNIGRSVGSVISTCVVNNCKIIGAKTTDAGDLKINDSFIKQSVETSASGVIYLK